MIDVASALSGDRINRDAYPAGYQGFGGQEYHSYGRLRGSGREVVPTSDELRFMNKMECFCRSLVTHPPTIRS